MLSRVVFPAWALLVGLIFQPCFAVATPEELRLRAVLASDVVIEGPIATQVEIAPSPFDAEAVRSFELQVSFDGAATTVRLPREKSWVVTARAEGFWIAPERLRHDLDVDHVKLVLHPAAWLQGRVTVADGEDPPDLLKVEATPSPDHPSSVPLVDEECTVEAARFRCWLPAGRLDLKLHQEGFIPHYLWGVEVAWRSEKSLPRLHLKPGASVVGWVSSNQRPFDPTQATPELEPLVAGLTEKTDRERFQRLRHQGSVNQRGFFQLRDVPPGAYDLVVRHPDLAATRLGPFVVEERTELEVDVVRLDPFLTWRIRIEPPTDPFHEPWRVALSQDGLEPHMAETVDRGQVAADGTWEVQGLSTGEYDVWVTDRRGSMWHAESVQVTEGNDVYEVKLPLRPAPGRGQRG